MKDPTIWKTLPDERLTMLNVVKSSKIVVYICILVFICRKTGTPSGKSAPRVGALPAEGPPEGQMEVVFHKSRPYRMKNPTGWKTLPQLPTKVPSP